jgi:membrane-associated HD superfamily phosphohydrolase
MRESFVEIVELHQIKSYKKIVIGCIAASIVLILLVFSLSFVVFVTWSTCIVEEIFY